MNSIATGTTSDPSPARETCAPGAPTIDSRPSVAVIGAGVSGLTAAYLLSRTTSPCSKRRTGSGGTRIPMTSLTLRVGRTLSIAGSSSTTT
jgi:cation diffusion facilitator CzcD-associated flavoprotein CzcO